jgi:rRNA maturation RNase YbeY
MTRWLLEEHFPGCAVELCVHLVGRAEIARLNEKYLGHRGSTDVIAFDYADLFAPSPFCVRDAASGFRHGASGLRITGRPFRGGELFISLDDTVAHARRFGVSWQAELARYVVHGLLHLAGHDDLEPAARRRMKKAENRLIRRLGQEFRLCHLDKSRH